MSIEPEDVRNYIPRARAGGGASRRGPDLSADALDGEPPLSEAEKALLESISASYFLLRVGLASLATAFPFLLCFFAGGDLLGSISAYYHEPAGQDGLLARAPRDVFVAVLCATGAFLYLYKGYTWQENWALNIAGIAAVAVALFPMDPDGDDRLTLHGAAAVTYFLGGAYVCLFRARDTLGLLRDENRRGWFKRAYMLFGAAMLLLPAAIWAIHNVNSLAAGLGGMIYWIEVAAIYVFAGFFALKSLEIRLIQRQRQ